MKGNATFSSAWRGIRRLAAPLTRPAGAIDLQETIRRVRIGSTSLAIRRMCDKIGKSSSRQKLSMPPLSWPSLHPPHRIRGCRQIQLNRPLSPAPFTRSPWFPPARHLTYV